MHCRRGTAAAPLLTILIACSVAANAAAGQHAGWVGDLPGLRLEHRSLEAHSFFAPEQGWRACSGGAGAGALTRQPAEACRGVAAGGPALSCRMCPRGERLVYAGMNTEARTLHSSSSSSAGVTPVRPRPLATHQPPRLLMPPACSRAHGGVLASDPLLAALMNRLTFMATSHPETSGAAASSLAPQTSTCSFKASSSGPANSSAPPDPMAPGLWVVSFCDLCFQRLVGEGSFGRVYLASWNESAVAVKLLLDPAMSRADIPHAVDTLLSESNHLQSTLQEVGAGWERQEFAASRHCYCSARPHMVIVLQDCQWAREPCAASCAQSMCALLEAQQSCNLALALKCRAGVPPGATESCEQAVNSLARSLKVQEASLMSSLRHPNVLVSATAQVFPH